MICHAGILEAIESIVTIEQTFLRKKPRQGYNCPNLNVIHPKVKKTSL